MLIRSTLGSIFIALCSVVCMAISATAQQADTTTMPNTQAQQPPLRRQLNVGADVSAPFRNALLEGRIGYELAADYFLKNEIYLAMEAGWGSSNVNYPDLKYSTTNAFVRAGFNKMLLPRDNPEDWGGMMLGMRLAAANISRSAAQYTIEDSLWGNVVGNSNSKNFGGYWAEITAGVRVELLRGMLAGWNIRGKFLLNSKDFSDLSPLHIAGYGRGDKNAVFDINFYLSYAVRWKRK